MNKILNKLSIVAIVAVFAVPFVGNARPVDEPTADSTTVTGDSTPAEDTTTVEGDTSAEEFVPEGDTTEVEGDTPVVEESSSNNGGGSHGSRKKKKTVPTTPTVLGASVGPNGEMLSCAPYLTTFMKIGNANNVEEVKKLQTFLNEFNGANLPITGFFGPMTFQAVKNLQAKYSNDILKPWDLAGLSVNLQPTGYAFKMTQWFVNTHKCPDVKTPAPVLK